jgi:hypothetical protein
MNTIFQRYAASLLPFFVLVTGAATTIWNKPLNWNADITFLIVVLGAVVTYIVALSPGKWQGKLKTGIAILTTLLAAVLPFVLPGGFKPESSIPVILVAVFNALSVEFGVQIRTAIAPAVVPVLVVNPTVGPVVMPPIPPTVS